MKSESIYTSNAPKPIGNYNQAVRHGDTVFVSGQIPIDVKTGLYAPEPIEEEATRVLTYVSNILEAANLGLKNVAKVSIFLKNMSDFPAVSQVYNHFFTNDDNTVLPARETIQVAALPLGVKVEVSCVAVF